MHSPMALTALLAALALDSRPPAESPSGSETTLVAAGSLTSAGARTVLEAAVRAARLRGTTGAFAVVDAGGSLLALSRLDGTFPAASRVATGKAVTAAEFRRPTKAFEEAVNGGRHAMTALMDFTPLQGGVPLVSGGIVVGALGVSGAASAAEDQELALAGAAALEAAAAAPPPAVRHLGAEEVRAAFEKGAVLVPPAAQGFQVHASRRTAPGMAEVHATETDVIYVLGGEATLVTGGTIPDSAATGPGELRGPAIDGGVSRDLRPGDLVVVPAGVPHWFQKVGGTFTYYVVKVGTAGGES